MTERNSIGARDEDGAIWWFKTTDAKCWKSTTLPNSQELFLAGGRWVVCDLLESMSGKLARIIDEFEALGWLAQNNYEPPDELSEYASARQLA